MAEFWLFLGLAFVGGIIEFVRLEGRVNTHHQLFVEREKQAHERHQELMRRLSQIEAKIDQSNGARSHGASY